MNCTACSAALPKAFASESIEDCTAAARTENFSAFRGRIDAAILDHLESCQDCPNDILWYFEIRDELNVEDFPCLHMAYACSSRLNRLARRGIGSTFELRTSPDKDEGIVIGYCPWCAIPLPVSGLAS